MWTCIAKIGNKLYQDGKLVKQIIVNGFIADIVNHGNAIWLKVQ